METGSKSTGLRYFTILLPDTPAIKAVVKNAEQAGGLVEEIESKFRPALFRSM